MPSFFVEPSNAVGIVPIGFEVILPDGVSLPVSGEFTSEKVSEIRLQIIAAGASLTTAAAQFSGACRLRKAEEGLSKFTVLSGQIRIDKLQPGNFPDQLKDLLNTYWKGDLAAITSIALGNGGLQLTEKKQEQEKERHYRWSTVASDDPATPHLCWTEISPEVSAVNLQDVLKVKDGSAEYGITTIQPTQLDSVPTQSFFRLAGDIRYRVETPVFGLRLLNCDWLPRSVWSWKSGDSEFVEFSDVAADALFRYVPTPEFEATSSGPLDAFLAWKDKKWSLSHSPELHSTGSTIGDTWNLPAAWQYAEVKNEQGDKSVPGAWVRWNLSPSDIPSRLATQAVSLSSGLIGLLELVDSNDPLNSNQWTYEFGLAEIKNKTSDARVRLRFEKKDGENSWKPVGLHIHDAQVYARTPEMLFFGRSLIDPCALPHAPDLAESLIRARVEFSNCPQEKLGLRYVKASLKNGDLELNASNASVEAWVPGPSAGLNTVSPTGKNLVIDADSDHPVSGRDRNQGLVDLPLGEFQIEAKKDSLTALKMLGPIPRSRRTAETISALLPWSTWKPSKEDPSKHEWTVYHRNMVLEHFEHADVSASRPIHAETSVDSDIPLSNHLFPNQDAERNRIRSLRDRFAVAATNPNQTGVAVENWYPSRVAITNGNQPTDVLPQLDWKIGDAIQSNLKVGLNGQFLEAGVSWETPPTAQQDPLAPPAPDILFNDWIKDGAANGDSRAWNGFVTPVFQKVGIKCLDAMQLMVAGIGDVVLVVFTDNLDRTFAWFPEQRSEPVKIVRLSERGLSQLRILPRNLTGGDELHLAGIANNTLHTWHCKIAASENGNVQLTFNEPQTSGLNLSGVSSIHVAIAWRGDRQPLMFVGKDNGEIFIYNGQSLESPLPQILASYNFGPVGKVEALDFRNMIDEAPNFQVIVARCETGVHFAIWGQDLNVAPRYTTKSPATLNPLDATWASAIQGFDNKNDNDAPTTLYFWSMVNKESNRKEAALHSVSIFENDPPPNKWTPLGLNDPRSTGRFPATSKGGIINYLAFGDRTEVASPYLVATTEADSSGNSKWMRWEPNWRMRHEPIAPTSDSYLEVVAHRGKITGASVFPATGRHMLVTGGDDGAVVVWDVGAGTELYRYHPQSWVADSMRNVRSADRSLSAETSDFYREFVRTPSTKDGNGNTVEGELCALLSTLSAKPIRLIDGAVETSINLACNKLLLRKDPANGTWWRTCKAFSLLACSVGSACVSGSMDNDKDIAAWPKIGGIPFYPVNLQFEFDSSTSFSPAKIKITAVLPSPLEVSGPIAPSNVPGFVVKALESEHGTFEISLGRQLGTYQVIDVKGNYQWTFPLASQLSSAASERSVPGRLQSIAGTVSWKNNALELGVTGNVSLGQALGQSWTLQNNLKLKSKKENGEEGYTIREALESNSSGMVSTRRMLSHLENSDVADISLGKGVNGESLVATITSAECGDVFVHDLETGVVKQHVTDRYRDSVLTPYTEMSSDTELLYESVLIHVDGTLKVFPAIKQKKQQDASWTFDDIMASGPRICLHPDSAVEKVLVFDAKVEEKNHRLYLIKCVDGSARLWGDQQGEICKFDFPNAKVTAIAISPAPTADLRNLLQTEFCDKNDNSGSLVTVIAVGRSDGTTQIYPITEEHIANRHKPVSVRTWFRFNCSVLSLSLAEDDSWNSGNKKTGLRLLLCHSHSRAATLIEVVEDRVDKDTEIEFLTDETDDTIATNHASSHDDIVDGSLLLTKNRRLFMVLKEAGKSAGETLHIVCKRKDDNEPKDKYSKVKKVIEFDAVGLTTSEDGALILGLAKEGSVNFVTFDGINDPGAGSTKDADIGSQSFTLLSSNGHFLLLGTNSSGVVQCMTTNSLPVWETHHRIPFVTDSKKASNAVFAQTVVMTVVQVNKEGRVEIWDLDFNCCRWQSAETIGLFSESDLHRISFRFIQEKPILVIGRMGSVEFWNLDTELLEARHECSGEVTHLDVAISDAGTDFGHPILLVATKSAGDSKPKVSRSALWTGSAPKEIPGEGEIVQLKLFGGNGEWEHAVLRKGDDKKLTLTVRETAFPINSNVDFNLAFVHLLSSEQAVVGLRANDQFQWHILLKPTDANATFKVAVTTPVINQSGDELNVLEFIPDNLKNAPWLFETKPDCTVARKFYSDKVEVYCIKAVDGLQEKQPGQSLVLQPSVRIERVNWPVLAVCSVTGDLRLWDRRFSELRSIYRTTIKEEAISPLPNGMLAVPSPTRPSLIIGAESGLGVYDFAAGTLREIALATNAVGMCWDHRRELSVSIALTQSDSAVKNSHVWQGSPTSLGSLAGVSFKGLGGDLKLNDLILLPGEKEKENLLIGTAQGETQVYRWRAETPESTLLFKVTGTVLSAAYPIAHREPVRVQNRLLPESGPDRNFGRLILTISETPVPTLNVIEADLNEKDPNNVENLLARWRSEQPAKVARTYIGDAGIKIISADATGPAKESVATPYLRIAKGQAPRFDLPIDMSTSGNISGRLTFDRHVEIEFPEKFLPGVDSALVARPSLVQTEAYTFVLEARDAGAGAGAGAGERFVDGVLIASASKPDVKAAQLNGVAIWETMASEVSVKHSENQLPDARGSLRVFRTCRISNGLMQNGTGKTILTGCVTSSKGWELHIAEQPDGDKKAIVFLKQTGESEIQGSVPASIEVTDDGTWTIKLEDTVFGYVTEFKEVQNKGVIAVRDDVVIPGPIDLDRVGHQLGTVIDLADIQFPSRSEFKFGLLSFSDKGFVLKGPLDNVKVPLDLIGGFDAFEPLPKQPLAVLQLVHRRDFGARMRGCRDRLEKLNVDNVTDTEVVKEPSHICPVMLKDGIAKLFVETLRISKTSFNSTNSSVSRMQTESVMAISLPEIPQSSGEVGGDVSAQNLVTATVAAVSDVELPKYIFSDGAIFDHAIEAGTRGILLHRTMYANGAVRYRIVNSPYHALEPQTLLEPSPENPELPSSPIPPSLLPPGDGGRIRLTREALFSVAPLLVEDSDLRSLRFAKDSTSKVELNRIALSEHTFFEDFEKVELAEFAQPPNVDSGTFVPAELVVRYGCDKPGAAQLHRIRGLSSLGDTTPCEVTLREPQQVRPPMTARLEVMLSEAEKDQNKLDVITTGTIRWCETLGQQSLPKLATKIELIEETGKVKLKPEDPVFSIHQRVGERLIAVDIERNQLVFCGPKVASPNVPIDLYLVSTLSPENLTAKINGEIYKAYFAFRRSAVETSYTLLKLEDPCFSFAPHGLTVDNKPLFWCGRCSQQGLTKLIPELDDKHCWNIVWAKDDPVTIPTDNPPKLFSTDGFIRTISDGSLRPSKLAAVGRWDRRSLLGEGKLERTLFSGESASAFLADPVIQQESDGNDQFSIVLRAKGAEQVGIVKGELPNAVVLVKYFGDGETLASNFHQIEQVVN